MIGKGIFRFISTDLERFGGPSAVRFSDLLYRHCKCRLAWHRQRKVWVVYRDRGKHRPPQTYQDVERPLSKAKLQSIVDTVRYCDCKMNGDLLGMWDVIRRRDEERWNREADSFADDIAPELKREMRRIREVMTDGRVRTKFVDLAGVGAGR